MNIDEFESSQNGGQPDADIETVDLSTAIEEPTYDREDATPEPEPEIAPEPETPIVEPEPEPEKKVQTPEENARFAEERRQRQADERAKAALDKLKESDPAFQTAKLLEEIYGLPIDQIQQRINQSRLEQIAEKENMPIEAVQRIDTEKREHKVTSQELEATKEQLLQTQYQHWQTRLANESVQVKTQYPMLSDDDLVSATKYMLETVKNPEIPLSQAVFAVHGAKITEALRQAARTEALAEVSGRTNSALPPQGGKPSNLNTLTDDEKYVAKMMGISEEDYMKYK